MKKQIKNKNIDPVIYAKKLKKIFKEEFFDNLSNKGEFKTFHSKANEFENIKCILNKEINFNIMNQEYDKIINEFINLYIFYKENYKYHKNCENDFKEKLKKLFHNSKKSYKTSLEKCVKTFILYLQNKLEKINYKLLLKKVDVEIDKDIKNKKEEELNCLEKKFSGTISLINLKIKSLADGFNEKVNSLLLNDSNIKDGKEIEAFVSKYEEKKNYYKMKLKKKLMN